jgi:hypothetical protein
VIRVHWSTEDGCYVALHDDYPSLSWLGPTRRAALAGMIVLLRDIEEGRA